MNLQEALVNSNLPQWGQERVKMRCPNCSWGTFELEEGLKCPVCTTPLENLLGFLARRDNEINRGGEQT